jgi:UTP--glucose-1-phosphate uridylyltransferase
METIGETHMPDRTVTKAVIAAAGFGTRFLPQTKAMPKEMLPLVDKPIIQYVVEELVAVGIRDIIIVTNSTKRSIEDHFGDVSGDLKQNLVEGGKDDLLEEVQGIGEMANFVYVRQKGPYGNGTPLLNVEHLIGNEPFIYTWSDDFIKASPLRFQQMITVYEEFGATVLSAIKATNDDDYTRYGFAGGEILRDGLIDVRTIAEKPGRDKAPSDLATVSGCLLTPDIFKYLHKAADVRKEGSELYYNDAFRYMIEDKKRIIAAEIQNGKYYDAGNKLEYLKTVVDFAMQHDDIRPEFRAYLEALLKND